MIFALQVKKCKNALQVSDRLKIGQENFLYLSVSFERRREKAVYELCFLSFFSLLDFIPAYWVAKEGCEAGPCRQLSH